MGERFLKIRNDPDKLKTTFKALTNEGKEDQMRNELNAATKSYLDSLKFNPIPQLPDEIENQILKISYYTAFMRTNVWASYDDSGHVTDAEITNTEVPTRIAKQFKHLIRLIAVVRGKETPDEEDLNSIRRVARDTTEAKKQRIMDLLYKYGLNTPLTIGDIAGSVEGLYRSSAPNHLKIMGDLGILALNEKGEYFVKEEFREFVEAAYTSSPVTLQKKLNSSSFSEPEKEKKPNLANNIEQTSSYLAEVGYAVKEDDIFKFMEENLKLSRTDSVKVLGLMMRDGTIFSPRPGFYKRT
jgi:DNA-binding transcriptional ArsR family regulator